MNKSELEALLIEIATLKECVEYYADLNNWILENLSNGYPISSNKSYSTCNKGA